MQIAEIKILARDAAGEVTRFAWREKGKRKFMVCDNPELADLVALVAVAKVLTQ